MSFSSDRELSVRAKRHAASRPGPGRSGPFALGMGWALFGLMPHVVVAQRSVETPRKWDGGRLDADLNRAPRTVLLGAGDSLTHGTMDASNNDVNTLNAYLERIAESLEASGLDLWFTQPLYDQRENRKRPFVVPTNLGVDGADAFSVDGLQYYKRVGAAESFLDDGYFCDNVLPSRLENNYDKVFYPINVKAGARVTQMDALMWNLQRLADAPVDHHAVVVFWVGNNDSSNAALGGGSNPTHMPVPAELIEPVVTRILKHLLRFGQESGDVAFEPYSMASIDRHLTEAQDFAEQYAQLVGRVLNGSSLPPERMNLFLLTLPYYSAVGYLFDSEDLEFYLRQLDPNYTVPATFARVAPPGEPITDPLRGDRVSLLTFGMMYTLMATGHTSDYINQALEVNGQQRDGLVLSEAEQQFVSARIDGFNDTIRAVAGGAADNVHLVDVGQFLNDGLAGELAIVVGGRVLGRKWIRGNGFTLDGVHPGYTAQALIANFVLEEIKAALDIDAPPHDLEAIFAADPYIDRDGDGWAPGPDNRASGVAELLFLLTDPDDGDADVRPQLPRNVWRMISSALLRDLLDIPTIRLEAERLGMVPDPP